MRTLHHTRILLTGRGLKGTKALLPGRGRVLTLHHTRILLAGRCLKGTKALLPGRGRVRTCSTRWPAPHFPFSNHNCISLINMDIILPQPVLVWNNIALQYFTVFVWNVLSSALSSTTENRNNSPDNRNYAIKQIMLFYTAPILGDHGAMFCFIGGPWRRTSSLIML